MTPLWQLFVSFAKVGVMTFGGGMAMLPLLEDELVRRRGWITSEELLDIYAIGQCTPGVIAVNTATFVGYRRRGDIGGIVATAGMVFPSLVIILALASVIRAFAGNPWVEKAFSGIRIAVCALILKSVVSMGRKSVIDVLTALLLVISIGLNLFLGISTVWIVLGTVVFAVACHFTKAGCSRGTDGNRSGDGEGTK